MIRLCKTIKYIFGRNVHLWPKRPSFLAETFIFLGRNVHLSWPNRPYFWPNRSFFFWPKRILAETSTGPSNCTILLFQNRTLKLHHPAIRQGTTVVTTRTGPCNSTGHYQNRTLKLHHPAIRQGTTRTGPSNCTILLFDRALPEQDPQTQGAESLD